MHAWGTRGFWHWHWVGKASERGKEGGIGVQGFGRSGGFLLCIIDFA